MKCRHCQNELTLPFLDLGSSPPSNAYLTRAALQCPEKWFPLRVLVCQNCWLVQTEDFAQVDELFSPDYAYFSATSSSWLTHSEDYVTQMVERFALNGQSNVVEVASNDGYLLQYVKNRGIRCTGIEPTTSTASAARAKGIDIVESFFNTALADKLAKEGKTADLMIANNVLAHVPDINDFVAGFTRLLKPQGVVTFEFPHLFNLVKLCQFDTIYHEHYSYLSLTAVVKILESNGLKVFDVEELPTHGGSLRVFAHRLDIPESQFDYSMHFQVDKIITLETDAGLNTAQFYRGFQAKAEIVKNNFLGFLLEAKKQGKKVAAYGAAAKGNTLLNFAGIRPDLISFVADRSTSKQGKFMPGSRIPIVNESIISEIKPDYVVILPWNIKCEITVQIEYVRRWGGKFVTAVPKMEVQ